VTEATATETAAPDGADAAATGHDVGGGSLHELALERAARAFIEPGRDWNDSDPGFVRARERSREVIAKHDVGAEAAQLLAAGHDPAEVVAAAVLGVVVTVYTETGAVADDLVPLLLASVLEDVEIAFTGAGIETDVDLGEVLPAMHRFFVRAQASAAHAQADDTTHAAAN
jgi:hypothetical protein